VVADDVDAAGLTHLLVVSGENVAFVLALVGPLLRRLPAGGRLGATLAVVGWFALLTRGEPSVLRAVAMASTRAVAEAAGREASGPRALGLGVTGLLLVDPLLVWSAGFQLSVAASTGILLLAGPVQRRLPGPRWLAEPLAVVIAAQLGVAPVAVPRFGPLPVAALPANLLVEPVAGLITMWGLTGGFAAGLVGGSAATVLHLPTRVALAWLVGVARTTGRLPLGSLGLTHLAVLAAAVGLAGVARRAARAGAGVLAVAVLVVAALAVHQPPLDAAPLDGGASVWQSPWQGSTATVLVAAGPIDPERLLASLRDAGVRHVDVAVLASAAPTQAAALDAVLRRYPPTLVWAPPGAPLAGAVAPGVGQRVVAGPIDVVVTATSPRLAVEVALDGTSGALR
jgi:ComEC/Rec2-related protein